jgi:hypothetical protein
LMIAKFYPTPLHLSSHPNILHKLPILPFILNKKKTSFFFHLIDLIFSHLSGRIVSGKIQRNPFFFFFFFSFVDIKIYQLSYYNPKNQI